MYSFTLQIPAGCLIGIQRYREYSFIKQCELLTSLMDRFCLGKYTIFFEKHKDGRAHAHGTVKDGLNAIQMRHTQEQVNINLNYRKDMKKIFKFDYLVTKRDEDNWNRYCLKEQSRGDSATHENSAQAPASGRSFLMDVELKE